MIGIETPTGDKTLLLRGIKTPAGLKRIVRASILTPDGSRKFWDITDTGGGAGGMTLTASPLVATGAASVSGFTPIETTAVTVSVDGATGPVKFSWAKVSGTVDWAILSPESATTRFRHAFVAEEYTEVGTFKCTATDDLGRSDEITITATAQNYGDPRGY